MILISFLPPSPTFRPDLSIYHLFRFSLQAKSWIFSRKNLAGKHQGWCGKKFGCVVCTISYFVCWWERQNFLVKITFCCLSSSSLALKATYIASSPTRLIFKAQYKISSIHNFFANRKKWNDKYGKVKEIFLENKKSVNPINCGRVTGPGWCSWLILESLFMGGGSAGYSQSAIRVSSTAFSHFHFFLWVFHFHSFLFYFPL